MHLIALIALAYFPINAFSSNENWKVVKIPNSSVNVIWDANKDVVDRFSRSSGGDFFGFRRIEPAIIEHTPTGLRSASTIPVKITASVSRAGVLAGVGALVRQGAKLGTRAVPYVGTALLAYDIYKELNPELEKAGYKYSEDIGDYVKYYDNALCIEKFSYMGGGYYSCLGVDSSELLALRKGGQRAKEIQDLWVRRARSEFERLADRMGKDYFEPLLFKKIKSCEYVSYGDTGVVCNFRGGSFSYSMGLKHKIKSPESDPNSFNDLIAKKVDENPDKFIKATNFPGYKEDVEVASGTKLNIGPVTDKSGNPVQVLVSFGRDSQGKTTADVQVTPRPDLKPGSAEAPNVRPLPDTSPATNPSNNPNPNEQPGTSPSPEPAPDTNPEPNVQPGTSPGSPVLPGTSPANGRDGKDGGLLCRFFPKILACDEQPETEEPNLEIPQETIDLNFTPDNNFSEYSECPAPVTFQALGAEYKISLEPACNLAAMMRPFIIAMAWLVASFFVARVVRNNA